MIKQIFVTLSFSLVFFTSIVAQQPDSILIFLADHFTQEKLHLQFDRSVYRNGETIFYKAYILSGNNLFSTSKTLYADWYNESGELIKQSEAPIFFSGASGSFDIPGDYTGDRLKLKVYTRQMLNFNATFVYEGSISVLNSCCPDEQKTAALTKFSTHVQLYPEGGYSIAGLKNRFAFKATDDTGNPVYIKGVLQNSKGEFIDSAVTTHDGMGSFFLLTAPKETYSFNWVDTFGKTGVTEITAQKNTGARIEVLSHSKKFFFTIERSSNAGENFKTMHLLIHRNEILCYKLDINMHNKASISSEISLDNLPGGITQFSLFNADWIPVAERIIFLNNHDYLVSPQIILTKKDLSKKGKNELEINLADTFFTNMSVAITDAGVADFYGRDIVSELLLTGELRGKVNNPAYYFSSDTISQNDVQSKAIIDSVIGAQLDLVMLTNGHRQFDWEQIAKEGSPNLLYIADTSYLQIRGKVQAKKMTDLKNTTSVNVILLAKDSAKSMLFIPVQPDGSFQQDNFFYYDSVKIFYSLNGKKRANVLFENGLLSEDERRNFFSNQKFLEEEFSTALNKIAGSSSAKKIDSFFVEQDRLKKLDTANTLKEVIVRTRVKSAQQILDEYYTSGIYSGEGNNYPVDVEGDVHAAGYKNIFYYLQTKVPGFHVENTGVPVWHPDSHGIPSVPAFLLDEVPISEEAVNDISVSAIAYIKAFRPPFLGSMLNGFSGVIALYSKRGYSPVYSKDNTEGLEKVVLKGYTRFKEFIQPDDTNVQNTQHDYRPTLYWNPFVLADKSNPLIKIAFFNNDISRRLCIIVEGINADGKLIRIVKVFE